jgi:hypothetical protein
VNVSALTFGDVAQMHYFKMYTVYCANQPHSDSTHTKCKAKNPAYASFLDVRTPTTTCCCYCLDEVLIYRPWWMCGLRCI